MENIIDLHMHSTASDGKDSVADLWEKVKLAGLKIFSLTDHDTVKGTIEMQKLVSKSNTDVKFIPGIECSSISEEGKCHILGYACDMSNPQFLAMVEKGSNMRKNKLEQRINFLKEEYGIEFSQEELAHMRAIGSVGKPNLAELIIKQGKATSIQEAIKKYINNCPTMDTRIPAEEVLAAINASGGVSVWAHPLGGAGEVRLTKEKFEKQLSCLMAAGLQGLECYYSRYTWEEVQTLIGYAKEHKLCISAGSDYHGRVRFPDLGTLNADNNIVDVAKVNIIEKVLKD